MALPVRVADDSGVVGARGASRDMATGNENGSDGRKVGVGRRYLRAVNNVIKNEGAGAKGQTVRILDEEVRKAKGVQEAALGVRSKRVGSVHPRIGVQGKSYEGEDNEGGNKNVKAFHRSTCKRGRAR